MAAAETSAAATPNPLNAPGQSEELPLAATTDVDVRVALKAGTITAEEAVAMMETKMEAELAAMRAELQDVVTGANFVAVRRAVARLTEIRCNFHQCTIYFAATDAPEDAYMKSWLQWMIVSAVSIVVLQSCVAVGLMMSVVFGTGGGYCESTSQCTEGGTFCGIADCGDKDCRGLRDYEPVGGGCMYCGEVGKSLPLWVETGAATIERQIHEESGMVQLPMGYNLQYRGFNLTAVAEMCATPLAWKADHLDTDGRYWPVGKFTASWCESCVRPIDGTIDLTTEISLITNTVKTMMKMDWASLGCASLVVAFAVVVELKDIELCKIAIVHAGDRCVRS
jgi:hypothetical protein